MALRRVEPLVIPSDMARAEIAGNRPSLRWVKPTDLLVDETYQRDLSRRSLQLIWQMVQNFAWSRMKPPIVVEADDGLHIIDGQHTAIAAASLGLPEIPIFVVEAPALDERARAFVGHNTDRIVVSPINIYKALLASGDPDAQDVANVCKRAGVRIRTLNWSMTPAEGDTMVVGTVRTLVKRRGVMPARRVLQALVKGRRAPIASEEIRAAEELICNEGVDEEALAAVVRIEGDDGLRAARADAAKARSTIWRAVADRYRKRLAKEAA